ncbi:hypothetical protein SCUCBS95973_005690 [Sporothrix curviconia]|uniref:Protein kinase domain-containing protein n=1 Tax=Sporothrix curviconia TaxID=1260050 RepID=A0ABP0BZC7_9PEZI
MGYEQEYADLQPQQMDPETGIKIMPYSKKRGYGWLWTYATLLVHADYGGNKNDTRMWMQDDEMRDCIALMMAHRPADRIDIAALKRIATEKLNVQEAEPYPQSGVRLEKRQCRDKDMFTDGSLKALNELVHHGVPTYNSARATCHYNIAPYPGHSKTGNEAPVPTPY